jgi:sugar phosphate isomerase/epimerase
MFTFGISTVIMSDKDIFSVLEIIGKSSFKFIEIRCEKEHFDYEDKGEIGRLKKALRKNAIVGVSLHPPVWTDIATRDQWTRMKSVREVEKVILVAKRLAVPAVILHPGKSIGYIEEALRSIEELIDFAKGWDVQIILENTFPRDFGSTIDELKSILDKFELPVCLDTSHASAKGNKLNKFLEIFNGRIERFHLSDSMVENNDDHFIPYEGKIDWEPVLKFLHAYKGIAVFEVSPDENFYTTIKKLEEIKKQWGNENFSP